MKKILYVTTVSRTINAFLIPHIEMLLKEGDEVDCACAIDKPLDKRLLAKGVNIFEIPFTRSPLSPANIKAFKKLYNIQKTNKYDIIHVHTPVASIYGRLLKVFFPKLKSIYTAHGYHFFRGAPKRNWLMFYPIEKIMAKLTDVTININEEDYKITKERLKPKQCCLINGVGIDVDDYTFKNNEVRKQAREKLRLEDEDFVILMIAELNENKNHEQLIEAMMCLKNRYPKIKAICVGEGDKEEDLKGKIKAKGLDDNVKLLGFREDVKELISAADMGMLLSYREGLPRSIMELMAEGKKVIGTDTRGIRDLVSSKRVGKLVKINDYDGTARAIRKYYLSKREKFIVPKEIEKYEVNNILRELSKVYDELVAEETTIVRQEKLRKV
ncbi:MAG: glycosyltransferase family 4 protein [Clostridium sp.]|nr:glycosyltransferase family 4 protein [Clostridium sp.]MDU7084657.1 glycosyltransferase family 4 protein [Clostridium sp.]